MRILEARARLLSTELFTKCLNFDIVKKNKKKKKRIDDTTHVILEE